MVIAVTDRPYTTDGYVELDYREDSQYAVRLEWSANGNMALISAYDKFNDTETCYLPGNDKARDCFLHPFAYEEYEVILAAKVV